MDTFERNFTIYDDGRGGFQSIEITETIKIHMYDHDSNADIVLESFGEDVGDALYNHNQMINNIKKSLLSPLDSKECDVMNGCLRVYTYKDEEDSQKSTNTGTMVCHRHNDSKPTVLFNKDNRYDELNKALINTLNEHAGAIIGIYLDDYLSIFMGEFGDGWEYQFSHWCKNLIKSERVVLNLNIPNYLYEKHFK